MRRRSDQLLTKWSDNGHFRRPKQKGMDPQIHASKTLTIEAGDGIRTHDVQLGNEIGTAGRLAAKPTLTAVYHDSVFSQAFAFVNVNKRLTTVFGPKCGNYHMGFRYPNGLSEARPQHADFRAAATWPGTRLLAGDWPGTSGTC